MAVTKAEVRNRAAQVLGIMILGQSLQDQDRIYLEQLYDEVYEDLKVDGLATWGSSGSVPNNIAPHVVYMVALSATETYGISDSRYTRILQKTGANAEKSKENISRLITQKYISQEDAKDY